ncbi:hypothetical protein HMPREF9374_3225 [Desmospora sp. 8437]|nr:hypothetical protein HMPREF9374_3225 [Desmospora sp. 8437]
MNQFEKSHLGWLLYFLRQGKVVFLETVIDQYILLIKNTR